MTAGLFRLQAQLTPPMPPASTNAEAVVTTISYDPLVSFDVSRKIPWVKDSTYTATSYQWPLRNTGESISVYSNDIFFSSESGANSVDALNFLNRTSTVPVAVIDPDGFDIPHEDLSSNVVFHYGSSVKSHGNEVASVIGAVGGNGIGMEGVCRSVPLILIEFSTRDSLTLSNAVEIAINQKARVVCFPSWCHADSVASNAFWRLGENDIAVFCATPNSPIDLDEIDDYPSSWRMKHIFPISCSMMDGSLLTGGAAWGSNTVFAAAPGRRVPVCTTNNGYGFTTGSSQACGYAAGVASLVRSRWPHENVEQLGARLKAGITPAGHATISGGIIDCKALLTTILELRVYGPSTTIEYSTNLSDWTIWGIAPDDSGFLRGH